MEDLFAKIPEDAPIRKLEEKTVDIDGKPRTAFVPPSMDGETLKDLLSDPGVLDFLRNG
jgi:hypothetical protein